MTMRLYIPRKCGGRGFLNAKSLHNRENFGDFLLEEDSETESDNKVPLKKLKHEISIMEDNHLSNGEINSKISGDPTSLSSENQEAIASDSENNFIEKQEIQSITEESETTTELQLSSPRWLHGKVPYFIDEEVYDDIIVQRIQKAMSVIQNVSCVVFERIFEAPQTSLLDSIRQSWLHFTNPEMKRECIHELRYGRVGEAVTILGFDCVQVRDIIHALLHALGFKDEVTHPQRNSYVRILWHNIQPKYRRLFKIQELPLSSETLIEYDTMSIMHFHDRAYSINGAATIASTVPGLIINPSEGLSLLDKMKLRLAFGQECDRQKVSNFLMTCKQSLAESNIEPPIQIDRDDHATENDEGVESNEPAEDVDSGNNVEEPTDNGTNSGDAVEENTNEENKDLSSTKK